MKVLLYSEYFLPVPGGTQSVVLELARGLSTMAATEPGAESIEVTVVTQTEGDPREDASMPFRIVRRPQLGEFARLLRATDLMHIAGPALLPLVWGFLSRKPVVVEHHGFQVACPNGLLFYEPNQSPCPGHFMAGHYGSCLRCNRRATGLGKSLQMLLLTPVRRWLSNRARMNIMPTDWLATVLKLKQMNTIYHGISAIPVPGSRTPSISTFAFHGRLVTNKGVGLFLQAAERLREKGYKFRLKIIGDGPERRSLVSQAAALNGHVRFLGHVPDDRLAEELSDVSAIVMPSLGGEVFGLVAAENMLRGKLLIVSNIGALCEVVGDTGLVFPTGDVAALASCMRQVLENPLLVASLGIAARARAVHLFNRDSMIQAHVSLYRETLRR